MEIAGWQYTPVACNLLRTAGANRKPRGARTVMPSEWVFCGAMSSSPPCFVLGSEELLGSSLYCNLPSSDVGVGRQPRSRDCRRSCRALAARTMGNAHTSPGLSCAGDGCIPGCETPGDWGCREATESWV